MALLPTTLHALLECTCNDERIQQLVGHGDPASIKAYSDIVYYNFDDSGLSLQLRPRPGYTLPRKPRSQPLSRGDFEEKSLLLDTVDVYTEKYSAFPIAVTYIPPTTAETEPAGSTGQSSTRAFACFDITAGTTGVDLVQALGEPDRKGGGDSKALGVWLEWTSLGIMAEFSGIHGHGRWDKENGAGGSPVGIWTFFQPGKELNTGED